MVEPDKTVLWSADSQALAHTDIVLNDSVDNYDEILIYGSANNTYPRLTISEYPIIPGKMMIGGPTYYGKWATGDNFILVNGTRMGWSGNSARVISSFFYGKNNGSTAWAGSYQQNRDSDVRPYKIVGLKYPNNYDRTLLWETTGNPYNTSITLSEPITHFRQIMVYGSGSEANETAGKKTTKNIYQTQNARIGADCWGYTPWALNSNYNYTVGCETYLSGNSGYVGSAWCFGMNNSTAYGGFRWTGDSVTSMMNPWKIWGIDRKNIHKLKLIQTNEASISADKLTGYEFDSSIISAIPIRGWDLTGYGITGASLTGNTFMWNDENVSATPLCSAIPAYTITILPSEHGTVVASMPSGYRDETVTLTSTPDTGWYKNGYLTTGCKVVNDMFVISANAIIQGRYRDTEITILDFYPIGSYFTTKNADFDPNVEWGGEWELDTKGKVTRGGTTVGQTGGEITHSTTVNEIPGHTHNTQRKAVRQTKGTNWGNDSISPTNRVYTAGNSNGTCYKSGIISSNPNTSGSSHNNVQKSLICKRWHRVG